MSDEHQSKDEPWDGALDRISGFKPVGWYWNGEIHYFKGGGVPNGVAHEYEPDEPQDTPREPANEAEHLLEMAWGIIANAGEGNWDREHPHWKDAATRWRDQYHRYLDLTIR